MQYHYYISRLEVDADGEAIPPVAYHWFSVWDRHEKQADREVSVRRPLLNQNHWWAFKTPDMVIVPDVAMLLDFIPKKYVWEPNVPYTEEPIYPLSFSLYVPIASRFGKRAVGFYLGMWPKYEDYVAFPEDESIWPIHGLITSGNIGLQPWLRREIDYKWRTKYRYMGQRKVPGGYIPLHFIDECYFLNNVPLINTRGCSDNRGLPWTEFEPTKTMVWNFRKKAT